MHFELMIPIALLAFVCELVDSSLGMGYGTTLTPLLLFLGHAPSEIVPAVLFSEFVTGILAGVCHHEFGNVDLSPGSRDWKITAVLTSCSVIGVLIAVVIAVNVPPWIVKLFIGALVLAMGLLILLNRRRQVPFSWRRICGLGFMAAFNKGISGGGYGPVVTGGQVLSGVRGRNAVGIASLAEGIASAVGVLVYVLTGAAVLTSLAPSLLLGAVLSVPASAFIVSRMPAGRLTILVGSLTTTLGGYTLLRLLL
jgi:uncharacterized membrane protein YfcA